ncbi:CgeB family protein [Phytoactinopolyspora halotolerans]|uniref:Glycosyltransferase n=1 Tax=Phytoactinopolyspora halotolerans TaxID=1981512 RepID=A0A6L9S6K5_9ACTN|nr:glycosyltransferase [Phytoactinopolyspora halotolerans]NEE00182.1 glycosyltransferase [Phytoactinopolyspora halotolerans]
MEGGHAIVHIGLIGGNRPDGFQENISDSLECMGHRTSYLGSTVATRTGPVGGKVAALARSALPGLATRSHQRLVKAALDRECDAVITVQGDLSPEAVLELRRNGVPAALWFPDAVCNLGRQRMLVAPYRALFFKDPLLVRRLRDTLELPVWYLPQACNPRRHRPLGDAGAERSLVVVGNVYPSRLMLLRRLHESGIPLVVYGARPAGWQGDLLPHQLHAGHPVFREDKARVFRTAAAVLNNLHPAEMHGVNLRLFEATAAGAAVLCERRPVLKDLFDLDAEVAPFGDVAELVGRARELLESPDRARSVGDAASLRAHAEHTYEHRLPTILERLT